MVRRVTALTALALAVALSLVFAAPALAGPTWLSALPASTANPAAQTPTPQVAADQRGDVVSVWSANDGTNFVVQYSYRQPGSGNTFTTQQNLTTDGSDATAPQVAMNANGEAVAAWQTSDGRIQAAYMQPLAVNFDAPQLLQTDAAHPPARVSVAIDAAGDMCVAWDHNFGGKDRIEASYAPAVTHTFPAAPTPISNDSNHPYDSAQVAMDGAGDATIAYYGFNGTHSVVQAAQAPAATPGSFGTPKTLSDTSYDAQNARVAMDGQDDATVVWQSQTASNHTAIFESDSVAGAPFPAGGTTISNDPTTDFLNPWIAENANGDAAVVWADFFNGFVWLAKRPAAGAFVAPVTPSTLNDVIGGATAAPAVTIDPSGNAVATWEQTSHNVAAAVSAAGGTSWATPKVIGSAGNEFTARLAADGIGNVLATWFDDTATQVQVAAYDGAPPIASNVSIPVLPRAGQALTFGVVPVDTWSPAAPAQTKWKVNGQVVATGANVTYTFPGAGAYQMEVDIFDAVGNELAYNAGQHTVGPAVSSPPIGGLRELDSPADCVTSQQTGCGTVVPYGLGLAYQPAISPDGRDVYAVGFQGGLMELSRNAATGALGMIGCMVGSQALATFFGCTYVQGLSGPASVAVSPDGAYVYVVTQNDNALVTLARDPATGLLTAIDCLGGCAGGGRAAVGIDNPWGVTVSGANVYVTSLTGHDVAEFTRGTGGVLQQLPTPNNCISDGTNNQCGSQDKSGILDHVFGVTVSPDGHSAYATAGGTSTDGDIVEFARDTTSGALTPLTGHVCISNNTVACPDHNATGLKGTEDLAVTGDGRNAYANSSQNNAVAELTRDPATGALSYLGCVGSAGSNCAVSNAVGLSSARGVAIAPGDQTVYVSGFNDAAVAALARDPATGKLTQLASPYDCVTYNAAACGQVDFGLTGARRLAVSPDGADVYVAGQSADTVVSLARQRAPAPATSISGASDGATYTQNQIVPVTFSCTDAGGPGIQSCTDSRGGGGGSDTLDTSTLGSHAYSVTALSSDNQTSSSSLHYTVVAAPLQAVQSTSTSGRGGPPVLAHFASATPVGGTVLVQLPGSTQFVPLQPGDQIPVGSLVDATHGTVQVTMAEPKGSLQTGQFFGGEFILQQSPSGVTTAVLAGGSFAGCPAPSARKKKHAAFAAKGRSKNTSVRSLWSNAHGNFQTRGRYASGAVSGTEWLTTDLCDGTSIKVTRDRVLVTNLVNRKKTMVKQGHSITVLAPGF